jgi:hypothetical protein
VLSALIKYTDIADEPAAVIIRVRPSTLVMEYQLTWRHVTKGGCLSCAKRTTLLFVFVSPVFL